MTGPTATTTRRAAALLGAVALLLLAACDGGEGGRTPGSASATPPTGSAATDPARPPTAGREVTEVGVTVTGGEVQAPGERVEVPLGSTVRLTVTSDAADEVHVHGYDRTVPLSPGGPATVELTADIPGVFEVELHEAGLLLTSLQVQ